MSVQLIAAASCSHLLSPGLTWSHLSVLRRCSGRHPVSETGALLRLLLTCLVHHIISSLRSAAASRRGRSETVGEYLLR